MDPNQTLVNLRIMLNRAEITPEDVGMIIDHFNALDGWLTSGGFPPADWRQEDDFGPYDALPWAYKS